MQTKAGGVLKRSTARKRFVKKSEDRAAAYNSIKQRARLADAKRRRREMRHRAMKVADEHSRRGGLRAPTFTASMVPGGGGSSVRSERSSIWAMPVNGTPATAATTNRSHHAPRHGPYSTATTTAAGGAGGAGAAPSRSLPTNSNHKSKLSPTVLERIAQNKARALALRANKGKKMIY